MTYPVSGFDDGTHISTTVKWYDPAKGYGFLVPDDGSPDIYCRAPALAAVGLETLLAGAAVACETAQGLRGPEVSRIVAVDFSASAPRQASFANARGNGRMAAGPGRAEAGPGASGRTIRAMVKWFHPVKGYGFLEPEDGSADVFCHLTVAQASGHDTLPQGAAVSCEIVQGDRGPQVSRILSVEPGNRTRSGGPRPALRRPLPWLAGRGAGVLRHGAAGDGQILRPGEGLRLRRA